MDYYSLFSESKVSERNFEFEDGRKFGLMSRIALRRPPLVPFRIGLLESVWKVVRAPEPSFGQVSQACAEVDATTSGDRWAVSKDGFVLIEDADGFPIDEEVVEQIQETVSARVAEARKVQPWQQVKEKQKQLVYVHR